MFRTLGHVNQTHSNQIIVRCKQHSQPKAIPMAKLLWIPCWRTQTNKWTCGALRIYLTFFRFVKSLTFFLFNLLRGIVAPGSARKEDFVWKELGAILKCAIRLNLFAFLKWECFAVLLITFDSFPLFISFSYFPTYILVPNPTSSSSRLWI